jgi:hypothetical protein
MKLNLIPRPKLLQETRKLTDVEPSFPIEIAAIDGDGQVNVASGEDAGHDADSSVLVDVLADHVHSVKAADDATIRVEARACDVDHHTTHHVTALRCEHQRLGRVYSCREVNSFKFYEIVFR